MLKLTCLEVNYSRFFHLRWLYEYQKGHSVPSLLLSHIEAGYVCVNHTIASNRSYFWCLTLYCVSVKVANEDLNSLLMFSVSGICVSQCFIRLRFIYSSYVYFFFLHFVPVVNCRVVQHANMQVLAQKLLHTFTWQMKWAGGDTHLFVTER